jgi:hypothetical protein
LSSSPFSFLVFETDRTGRTHQIRVHLRHLGHCIANDPNYGGDIWYDNPEGRERCEKAKAWLDAMDLANCEDHNSNNNNDENFHDGTPHTDSLVTTDVPATGDEIRHMTQLPPHQSHESEDEFIRRTCVWCVRCRGQFEERAKMEFLVRSAGIWLHALQYQVQLCSGDAPVCFAAPPPAWSLM